jgi:hypothetical protein
MPNDLFRNYEFDLESNVAPTAIVLPEDQEAVVTSLVKLDGTASIDPEGKGLTYKWRFTQVPIGSQVERYGFTGLEDDASIVTFAPDITGPYVVELVVSDGSLDSDPALANVDVRVILVPYHRGVVPDASFIWNYLSDFWDKVEGREKFETFWSAAIQIVSAEMLKLYQYDYNKSIRDIQEVAQKRWLSFSFGLPLNKDATYFVLAEDQAGFGASTFTFDPITGVPNAQQPGYTSQVAVPINEGQFSATRFGSKIFAGRVLRLENRAFLMARSSSFTLSVNNDRDGSVLIGTQIFRGSGFTSSMSGGILKVAGSLTGISRDWRITTVLSSTQVEVTNLDGVVTLFPANANGLSYSVLPASSTHSVFIADVAQVPAGLEAQAWRFSSTLISTEYDYEDHGVSPGDTLEIEITRTDLAQTGTLFAQVVSVCRNCLGFVLGLEDLRDGVPAEGLDRATQASLAEDLQVVGLSQGDDGSPVYAEDAELLNRNVRSLVFKRAYYEKKLTPYDDIDLGVFSIRARPVQIIRNKALPVVSTITSVPMLQEYIRQPEVIKRQGKIFLSTIGGTKEVTHEPHLLVENLDYVLDDEARITGVCGVTAGLDEITVPFGDLIDRSVHEQDVIEVVLGFQTQKFEIRRVLAADKLRVYPTPGDTSAGAAFTIRRRLAGKYLRLINNRFNKNNPAPKRLWAEVVYFDNGEAIEKNFGTLVGLTREDLEKANSSAPYKSAVAGLMYALVNGPTISNLKLAGHILLGMPFTQAAGIIKEINPSYRLREDGSVRYGRILVEGRDASDKPTGLTYVYLYPQGRQKYDAATNTWTIAVSDYSGLAINPNTGLPYAVADRVNQFVPLSKGVDIQEYLATPEWSEQMRIQDPASFLRQYHSFRLVVNADLVSASDTDLSAIFLQRAKAHYARLLASLLKSVDDDVTIVDAISFGRQMQFYDLGGLKLPSALKLDAGDENASLLLVDGRMFTRYLSGEDLVTTSGSLQASSASGGFHSPRISQNESWDPPLVRPGDLLEISGGFNSGRFPISSLVSDTQLQMVGLPDQSFISSAKQRFSVYRPIQNPIWDGLVKVTIGDGLVATQETVGVRAGIFSAGVSVGDHLVFTTPFQDNPTVSRVYTITSVVPSPVSPYVTVVPDPVEATGEYYGWVIREPLLFRKWASPFSESSAFWADFEAHVPYVDFVDRGSHKNDWLTLALLHYGDIIQVGDSRLVVLRFDPYLRRAYTTGTPSFASTDAYVEIELRPNRGSAPITMDLLDRSPPDALELVAIPSLVYDDKIVTNGGSSGVTSTKQTDFSELLVNPGDFLVLYEGPDSTKLGLDGLGTFMIQQVVSNTVLYLLDTLSATGEFHYGIRRKVSDER